MAEYIKVFRGFLIHCVPIRVRVLGNCVPDTSHSFAASARNTNQNIYPQISITIFTVLQEINNFIGSS